MTLYNVHKHGIPRGAISIMRPGPLGNPWVIGSRHPFIERKLMTRGDVREFFDKYTPRKANFEQLLRGIRGRQLVCCCVSKPWQMGDPIEIWCHGMSWLTWANEGVQPK